jgi:hypothetical protein
MNDLRRLLQAAGCWLLASNTCLAATMLVDVAATKSGWVQHDGTTNALDPSTTNYVAGKTVTNGKTYSNFFVFDLSGIQGTIESATLKLQNPVNGFYSFDNDYYGQTNSYTYSVTELGSSGSGITASDLFSDNWQYPYTGVAVWIQINNGTPVDYGSALVNEASNGTTVEIPLTTHAIDSLNALVAASSSDYLFALGGGLQYDGARKLHIFANTGGDLYSRTLSLVISDQAAVPVPPALLLLGSGLALLATSWRNRRK